MADGTAVRPSLVAEWLLTNGFAEEERGHGHVTADDLAEALDQTFELYLRTAETEPARTDDQVYARRAAAVRAAWFLNKPAPTPGEEAQYREKGLNTTDGFFAAVALLSEAVTVIEATDVERLLPHQRERAEGIVAAFYAATRPVPTQASGTTRTSGRKSR